MQRRRDDGLLRPRRPLPLHRRPVVNDIQASFRFDENGLIVDHVDEFDFRNWAKQALGPSGHLVALLPLLRSKARAKALDQLETFKRDETGSSI